MWNETTGLTDPLVEQAKRKLLENSILDPAVFVSQNPPDLISGSVLLPVILLIDRSAIPDSACETAFGESIRRFAQNLLSTRFHLEDNVDLAVVTYGTDVKVLRNFGTLTPDDQNTGAQCTSIHAESAQGNVHLASGLFTAWALAEQRNQLYRDLGFVPGVDSRAPLIVLVSSLANNETQFLGDTPFVSEVLALYNAKIAAGKLGLVKARYGTVSVSCDAALRGFTIDSPDGPQAMFQRLTADLAVILTEAATGRRIGFDVFNRDLEKSILRLYRKRLA